MRIAIIGGGPAGLVTLKYLLEIGKRNRIELVEVRLFEREAAIGGTFQYRTYEEGELVSSRHLTGFSDFRIADSDPDFISTDAYCKYLHRYCTHFDLWPRIELQTKVQSVKRHKEGGHIITLSKNGLSEEQKWHCDAIAVCSGLNVTPNLPAIKGLEHVPKAFHSQLFKERAQFGENKNVLILGAGETAMDIAYLAITSPTKSVTLCHRGGWKNEPKRLPDPIFNGNVKKWSESIARHGESPPTDTGFASLFDTAYIHPKLEGSRLQWDYYDYFIQFEAWLTTGTRAGVDQYVGELRGDRRHARYAVAMKSNKAQPYLSQPYRPKSKSTVDGVRSRIVSVPDQDPKDRQIDVAPWPEYIDPDGVVHFQDNGRPEYQTMKDVVCKPDIVIYATGYTQVFPFFDKSYPTIFDADIRRVWKAGMEDIGFMGFVRPSFGAIPPLAELQAQLWVANLFQSVPRPLQVNETYLLEFDANRRLDYIVDHDTYAYVLAQDMGATPSLRQVLSFGPTVFLTWALGPNFNTKFRLVGPWAWDGAAAIMEGELWRVIKRRKGFIVWTFLTILPITLFGMLSLLYFIFYTIKDGLAWPLLLLGFEKRSPSSTPPPPPPPPPEARRGRDPLGIKRARAEEQARGPEKLSRA